VSRNRTDASSFGILSSSQLGNRVDILAPGTQIFTTNATEPYLPLFTAVTGTSFAAPHITGVAGMIWSVNPSLTGADVRRIIIDSAILSLTYQGTRIYGADADVRMTYPVLNAHTAVQMALDERNGDIIIQPDHVTVFGRVVHSLPYLYPDSGFRQFGIGNIEVKIFSYDEGVLIDTGTARLLTQMQLDYLLSDDIGRFAVPLMPGRYELRFYREGHEPVYRGPLTVNPLLPDTQHWQVTIPYPPSPSVIRRDSDTLYSNLSSLPDPERPRTFAVGVRTFAEVHGFTVDWIDGAGEARISRAGLGQEIVIRENSGYYRIFTVATGEYSLPVSLNGATPFTQNWRLYLRFDQLVTILNIDMPTVEFGYCTEGGHYIFTF